MPNMDDTDRKQFNLANNDADIYDRPLTRNNYTIDKESTGAIGSIQASLAILEYQLAALSSENRNLRIDNTYTRTKNNTLMGENFDLQRTNKALVDAVKRIRDMCNRRDVPNPILLADISFAAESILFQLDVLDNINIPNINHLAVGGEASEAQQAIPETLTEAQMQGGQNQYNEIDSPQRQLFTAEWNDFIHNRHTTEHTPGSFHPSDPRHPNNPLNPKNPHSTFNPDNPHGLYYRSPFEQSIQGSSDDPHNPPHQYGSPRHG